MVDSGKGGRLYADLNGVAFPDFSEYIQKYNGGRKIAIKR